MTWTGKTIDAPVFAPPVGVDRAVERKIRRRHIVDQASGTFFGHLRAKRWRFFGDVPSIGFVDLAQPFKTAAIATLSATPVPQIRSDISVRSGHCPKIEQNKNIRKTRVVTDRVGTTSVGLVPAHVGFHQVTPSENDE
jgi:hypothetical protein